MNLFDASALLCFLADEPGAERVEQQLVLTSGVCSAANWAEVAQKLVAREQEWAPARALLLSYGLTVEPVTQTDAEAAAALWRRGSGLSLADRLCLATGRRLQATIWTADTTWGSTESVRQVR